MEDKNCKYAIRDNPVFKENDFDNLHYDMRSLKVNKDEVILTKADYELLDYESVLKHLNNRTLENIYCRLDYAFQKKIILFFQKWSI